jgi:hypothetical protein
MFKGYRFTQPNGEHYPPDWLEGEDQVMAYYMKHKNFYPELMICDGGDCIIIHVIEHKTVFPPALKDIPYDYCAICGKCGRE